MRERLLAATAAAFVFAFARAATAKVFLTQEEALKLAFPGAVAYVAIKDGRLVGTAYFDTHVVRTMTETLMVAVDPAGAIMRVEVLSFSEPEEYLPKEHWYAQFPGRSLDDDLSLTRGIRPVSGATLTARATTDAARRALALHQVLARRRRKAA